MQANDHITTDVRYLRRHEIDAARWDECVRRAPNGWIYLQSFYLDATGPWDALVSSGPADNYEYVMPLPRKRKYGLTYAYITPMAGQLGIVGLEPVTVSITNNFLRHIPRRFLLVDTLLNEYNPPPSLPGIEVLPRTNLVLPLEGEYPALYEGYTDDARKNLRRTQRAGLVPDLNIPVATVIDMYRNEYGKLNRAISGREYKVIAALFSACIDKGLGFTLGIRDPANTIHAAAFFGIDDKRIYYLLGAPGPEGRRYNAVHALIDEVIRSYAASGLVFDFEGSDIPSVAAFYRKFGPVERSYYQVRITLFPRWLRRLTGFPAPFPQWQDRKGS